MAKQSLLQASVSRINSAFDKIAYGKSDLHLVESGVAVFIDQNRSTEIKPKSRAIVAMNPTASILIKKKAFSTFKATNDLRWMDKTEKMLLRTTKALFALKVAQLRAYESLTKLDNFYEETGDINFSLLADLISSSRYLQLPGQNNKSSDALALLASFGAAAGIGASVDDVIKIVRRNAFSTANTKTTWIVDPDDVTNYGTGPGTGVIEICTFTSISTSVGVTSEAKSATIGILDPHRIMNIIEDDIEMAIEEALYGTLGLMNDLAYAGMGGEYIDPSLIVSSALEVFGLGKLDGTMDIDYIRDRLRVFYLGKWIINVNDGVHIYIAGNKSVTNNSDIESSSFDTSLDDSYFQIDENILEAERKLYTNQNISSSTYKNIRKYSNNSFIMQHVFGGYVKGVSESYSVDRTTISVSCQDNMGWLTGVRFMEEPSLLDPRAPLEDPVTPFDIKTNSASNSLRGPSLELLSENKILLKSGLLSHSAGLLAGYNANESNIFQGQYSGPGSMYGAQIVQHPSGLVYRWRTGVLGLSSPFSPTGASSNGAASAISPVTRQNYGFSVTNSVVANLDVANVISVMITGQPYNIETFTQLAYDAMNVVRVGNSLNPSDALSFTLDSIRKQNPFYGNFKPFRMITMSEQTINKLSNDTFAVEDTKNKLSILRKKKNDINRKIRILKSSKGNESIQLLLEQERSSIDISINSQIESVYRNNGSSVGGGVNASDLFDINFNIFGQNKALNMGGNLETDHDLNRAMMRVATMRRIEDVKLNRDQNLLIVSDQYDLNPDIKAYMLKLRTSGFKLFQGNYMNVYDRCAEAATVTMMEFFCNSQGHLEIRPPQYNKTPLSVLNALSRYQSATKRKIVPDFLFSMFGDRVSSLKLEIHATNIRIAIIALLMNKYPDSSLIPGVAVSGKSSFMFFGVSYFSNSETKTYESNIDKYTVNFSDTHSNYLKLDIGSTEDGDILFGNIDTPIGNFDEIVREYGAGSSTGSIYDKTLGSLDSLLNPNKSIAKNSSETTQKQDGATKTISDFGTPDQIVKGLNAIVDSFRKASGHNPASGLVASGTNGEFIEKDLLIGMSESSVNSGGLEARLDKLFDELEQAVSKRNSLVNLLKKNQEKKEELDRIEQDLTNGFSEDNTDFWEDPDVQSRVNNVFSNKTTSSEGVRDYAGVVKGIYEAGRYTKRAIDATKDFLAGKATQGTLFDHLIDDDMRNLLGPGSGRRFVIYDEQIKGYEVRESEPQMTRVDVFGTTPLVNDQMKAVTGGENFSQWGGAVDYDLWRQYGYKWKVIQDAPFISDAETQAKPLALQHLALQRAVIFSGSMQLAGNEYYQPGDTVYIPSKGLLFYVATVSHSFGYGSSFDTNLTLMYGHPPGVYLPTPMDIIGQSYSKDTMKQGGYIVRRKNNGDDSYRPLQPDCAIRFPKSPKITESNLEYLLSHKNNMVKFYNMVTDLSNGLLTSGRVLFIRGFTKDDSEEADVLEKLNLVSGLFQNPVMLSQKLDTAVGDDLLADFLQPTQSLLNINAGSGMNKELKTMFLPNGAPVTKVQKEQILLQVAKLNRNASETEFTANKTAYKCFSAVNLKDIGKLKKEKENYISDFDALSTTLYPDFPKGGPSQSTWLEMDDLLQNIFSSNPLIKDYEKVIEIGILELDTAKVKLLKSLR